MARNNVKLDHSGLADIAKSADMQRLVRAAAEKIADNVRGEHIRVGAFGPGPEIDLPVTVSEIVTDRAHASVALAHPAGAAVQAKHGVLTRAASAEGLTVKGR